MTTRRRFLALIPAMAAFLHRPLSAQNKLFARRNRKSVAPAQSLVFFGCDTDKGAKGIYIARFDAVKGQLSVPTVAAECFRPSYLAQAQEPGGQLLFAANEGDLKTSMVTAYRVAPGSGSLQKVSQVPAGSSGPCYISIGPTGRTAFTANYTGSSVSTFRVGPDGQLSQPVQVVDFKDKIFHHHGPNPDRQEAPHPHCATVSPDGRFLVVCDLGNDAISIFPIDIAEARLGSPTVVGSRVPGAGPRHVAFHPNGRWAYVVDELTNQVNQYLWGTAHNNGAEQAMLTDTGHTVSTLDPGFHGKNTAAEIVIAPSGDFAYVSNRGENSLAVFSINQSNGFLTPAQRISCGGKTPRHFTLDPTGRWLLCGNQDSSSITVFAREAATGRLSGPVQTVPLESPMFTQFV